MSKIIFSTLRAEMARQNIRIQDIAAAMEESRDTTGRKLSGKTQISLQYAFAVRNKFFPDMKVEDLFSEAWRDAS